MVVASCTFPVPMKPQLLCRSTLVAVLSVLAACEPTPHEKPRANILPAPVPSQPRKPPPPQPESARPTTAGEPEPGGGVLLPVDATRQPSFMPPWGGINCIYTPRGGTHVYKPRDGGPELSCDRHSFGTYDRVYLGPKGPADIVPSPGDASCCSDEPVVQSGERWAKGPFSCEVIKDELVCRRDDGPGFAISRRRVRRLAE